MTLPRVREPTTLFRSMAVSPSPVSSSSSSAVGVMLELNHRIASQIVASNSRCRRHTILGDLVKAFVSGT